MECGEKGMSSMQKVFSTYCEAVCILSESERQILERKGKERKKEAFHLSESMDRLSLDFNTVDPFRWAGYIQLKEKQAWSNS